MKLVWKGNLFIRGEAREGNALFYGISFRSSFLGLIVNAGRPAQRSSAPMFPEKTDNKRKDKKQK